jgi:hypothetical protein
MDVQIVYIDKCRYKIQEKKKFHYGIPAYGPGGRSV